MGAGSKHERSSILQHYRLTIDGLQAGAVRNADLALRDVGECLGRRGAVRAAPLHADAIALRCGDGCLWGPVVDVL